MAFSVANNSFHNLCALLIRKDQLYLEFFAQQQFHGDIARHSTNRHFNAAAIYDLPFAIPLEGDFQAEVNGVPRPSAFGRPILLIRDLAAEIHPHKG
jgi:hypothetical protein